jgi:hypothetical protein
MSDLIATRNRVRDMLTEQEADPWLDYTEQDMRDVLTDEMTALMRLELQHEAKLTKLEQDAQFPSGEVPLPQPVKNWKTRIDSALLDYRANMLLIEKAEGQIAAAEKMIISCLATTRGAFERAQRDWAKLSDAERAYLDKPTPNPKSVRDYPLPSATPERGWAYPEPTAKRRVQMRKLRDTLEFLERDIVAQEGEA